MGLTSSPSSTWPSPQYDFFLQSLEQPEPGWPFFSPASHSSGASTTPFPQTAHCISKDVSNGAIEYRKTSCAYLAAFVIASRSRFAILVAGITFFTLIHVAVAAIRLLLAVLGAT